MSTQILFLSIAGCALFLAGLFVEKLTRPLVKEELNFPGSKSR